MLSRKQYPRIGGGVYLNATVDFDLRRDTATCQCDIDKPHVSCASLDEYAIFHLACIRSRQFFPHAAHRFGEAEDSLILQVFAEPSSRKQRSESLP